MFLETYILKKTLSALLIINVNVNKVKPLNIMLPKTRVYVKSYDGQTKWFYFLIEDDGLVKIYSTIWDKVSVDIKKEFDNEPVLKLFENQNKISWR